jgi:hypothetical protein
MAKKYHFNTAIQYSWGTIFTRNLDLNLIPFVRCERDVDYVEFNAVATIAGASAVAAPKSAAEASAPPQVTISYDAGSDLCSVSDSNASGPVTMACDKLKDYVREYHPSEQVQP